MLYSFIGLAFLASTTTLALNSPCPSQQSVLQSSAKEWPKPTGDVSSYISSYSSVHNGVFSNCESFTSGMPASLTSPYQAWVTSANNWSMSFDSMVSASASTCLALVAPIVIALPRCADDNFNGGGTTVTSDSSSPTASSGTTAAATSGSGGSSGAAPLNHGVNTFFLALMACASAVGALAVML